MLRPVLQLGAITKILPKKNVTADGIVFNVPAGYLLELMIVSETGGESIPLDISTAGSSSADILEDYTISANGTEVISINQYFSDSSATAIYVATNESVWGASVIDCYGLIRKVK